MHAQQQVRRVQQSEDNGWKETHPRYKTKKNPDHTRTNK